MLLSAGDSARGIADPAAFERDLASFVAQHRGSTMAEVELGPVLEGLGGIAARHGVRLPAELVLAGKALAQVQLTASALDPDLDPLAAGRLVRPLDHRAGHRGAGRPAGHPLRAVRAAGPRPARLVESVERLTGARPGARLQVDVCPAPASSASCAAWPTCWRRR